MSMKNVERALVPGKQLDVEVLIASLSRGEIKPPLGPQDGAKIHCVSCASSWLLYTTICPAGVGGPSSAQVLGLASPHASVALASFEGLASRPTHDLFSVLIVTPPVAAGGSDASQCGAVSGWLTVPVAHRQVGLRRPGWCFTPA
jgi:hypothetical protein